MNVLSRTKGNIFFSRINSRRLEIRFVGGLFIIDALTKDENRIVKNKQVRRKAMTTSRLDPLLLWYNPPGKMEFVSRSGGGAIGPLEIRTEACSIKILHTYGKAPLGVPKKFSYDMGI